MKKGENALNNMEQQKEKTMKGISVLNPVQVDRDIYLHSIDLAIKQGYNHIQLIGPIHDPIRGNVDGMIFYDKYARFNDEKDADYVRHCIKVVNEALDKSHAAGIKTYMWHHELDVPNGFTEAFPEILNDYGDVEVSHPLLKDFLENKLSDFFTTYPKMDGLVLTFYETKIPLLRLKHQKLGKMERVKYVTQILYDTCKKFGKELIVRTDATLEEDYVTLLRVFEEISTDMVIMDKWTQFDWSLTLPCNQFIRNIKKNPLLIETDLFGEYFGKGRLPLMLKDHILEKFSFCEAFQPCGYVSRIDRSGFYPFDDVNEVNLVIMHAVMSGENVDVAIDKFFLEKYGKAGVAVRGVMEKTEDIVRRILFLNGYYYNELSRFPSLNHSKNHFYFEMMKEKYSIASDEWFVPIGWERGPIENVFKELETAKQDAAKLLENVLCLKALIKKEEYDRLLVKFQNLDLVAKIWETQTKIFYAYARYFESESESYKEMLFKYLSALSAYNEEGKALLGDEFHCVIGDRMDGKSHDQDFIGDFIRETKASFAYEEKTVAALKEEELTDYIVCGGSNEGHRLQKEVNFSDTLLIDGELVRIPGNRKGLEWSMISAHGWFSYELKIRPNQENTIKILVGSNTDQLAMKVIIGENEKSIKEQIIGKKELTFHYLAKEAEETVRIRIEKISANMPCIYTIKSM